MRRNHGSPSAVGHSGRRSTGTAALLALALGVSGALGVSVPTAPAAGAATAADDAFGDIDTWMGGVGNTVPAHVSVRPMSLAVDGTTLLVADGAHNLVRSTNIAGTTTGVVAGQGFSGAPVMGTWAATTPIGFPSAVVAGNGNRYVADPEFCRVYRIDAAGTINLFAGSLCGVGLGDGGPATSAGLNDPEGLAVGPDGAVYIAEYAGHRVRKVTVAGTITTVAGNGTGAFAGDGGQATAASLKNPQGIAVDASGNLYIADSGNHRVRKVTAAGVIATVAGTGTAAFAGDGGPAAASSLNAPEGVAISGNGAVVIADTGNNRVRAITGGMINTVAGTGQSGFAGDGGPPTAAKLAAPRAVAFPDAATMVIADRDNYRVRKVSLGMITTILGNGDAVFAGQGLGTGATQLGQPVAVAVDAAGNRYVADADAARVFKVSTGGTVTTLAGTGVGGSTGDGGPASAARLQVPIDVAADASGNVFIADIAANRIRRVDGSTGVITTYAGGGAGGDGGAAVDAVLDKPTAVTVNGAGTVYVSEKGTNKVRSIHAVSKVISTVAGNGTAGFSGDGGAGTAAQLNSPGALGSLPDGALLITDGGNRRIRKLQGGTITTVIGNGSINSSGDGGPASAAGIALPKGLAVDSDGSVFVSEIGRVRRVRPDGIIGTVAGDGTSGFTGDGGPATAASFRTVGGLAVERNGTLLVADSYAARVRRVFGVAARSVRFHAVTPQRLVDSRTLNMGFGGAQPLGPGQTRDKFFSGIGPVAGRATAVVMNVTVTGGTAASYLSVFPAGDPLPGTANLNFGPGQTVPNLVTVAIPPNGEISFYNKNGSVHVIADVVGYYDDGTTTDPGHLFTPMSPYRILDSRPPGTGFAGPVPEGGTKDLLVAGAGTIPADTTAVVMNVTVTGGTASSYLTAFPKGAATPNAANLLFGPNQTISNLVTVKVGAGGKVSFFNQLGEVHVVADVVGVYRPGSGYRFHPMSPVRVLDSRNGTGGQSTPWGPDESRAVHVAGELGIPADAMAVVANMTVTNATSSSYLTVYPAFGLKPEAANIVVGAGQTVPNLTVAQIGGLGYVAIYNQKGSVDVIADVAGYFAVA